MRFKALGSSGQMMCELNRTNHILATLTFYFYFTLGCTAVLRGSCRIQMDKRTRVGHGDLQEMETTILHARGPWLSYGSAWRNEKPVGNVFTRNYGIACPAVCWLEQDGCCLASERSDSVNHAGGAFCRFTPSGGGILAREGWYWPDVSTVQARSRPVDSGCA